MIIHNGTVVGALSSGGYGYTIGKSIAYGYVPKDHLDDAGFQIEVLGKRVAATRHKGALYDPARERTLKC